MTQRHGTFSSSQVWKLLTKDRSGKGWGDKAKTYIKQVGYEIKLGRPINKEISSKPTAWGTFIESRVFEILPLEYRLVSQERLFHSKIKHYSGAPDIVKPFTVADAKCPFSLETFCDKIEALQDIEIYKKEFPEDYWQHISNAILLEDNGFPVNNFEAIIYVPYQRELTEIRAMASNFDGDQNKISFIHWADDNDLPFLIEGNEYKNLNIIQHPVLEEDKELLIDKIEQAVRFLNGTKTFIMVANYIPNDKITLITD